MNAALFQPVLFEAISWPLIVEGLPWPVIGALVLLRLVLKWLPENLRAFGAMLRDRSQAKLCHVVAERIAAAPLEASDLMKMLNAVVDGSPSVAEKPAEDVSEARPGPPAVPPPREEPPPRE